MNLRAWVYTARQLDEAMKCSELEAVYVPLGLAEKAADRADKIILLPPEYLADCEEKTEKALLRMKELGFDKALAHTSGHIELLGRNGFRVCGGNRLNCTNSESVRFFAECGLTDIIVSPEITIKRMNSLEMAVPIGFLAYGCLPMMLTRRCPISDGKPCGKPRCGRQITDRKGNKLNVICSENTVEILNSDVLMLSGRLGEFHAAFAVLRFTTEKEITDIVKCYAHNEKPDVRKYTTGLYYRGVE